MINSLMSRMNAADNLSVQQLHQAVADGTLPAYVGVPMIQDKLKQQQQAMAMQQPQQQPPIADQIMAASAPHQGIDTAQSNLPTQMAEGGIIGYAAGGMDDEDEDRELAQLYGSGTDNDLIQAIAAGDGGHGIHPSAAIQMRPESKSVGIGSGHKYHDAVIKEAERQGLDPNIALHALYRETGNLSNPETARSKAGAIGVMQLMPATAKSLGVDPTDPMQNIQGGVTYLKQMNDKYQNPQLTLMAYNAGPGRVDKALRHPQGLASLPAETRNYSEGGVAHFEEGGIDTIGAQLDALRSGTKTLEEATMAGGSRKGGTDPELLAAYQNAKEQRNLKEKEYSDLLSKAGVDKPAFMPQYSMQSKRPVPNPVVQSQSSVQPAAAAPAAVPAAAPAVPSNQGIGALNTPAVPMTSPTNQELGYDPSKVSGDTQSSTGILSASDKMAAKLLENIANARTEAKKDRETNKYLALMQAGFGMMGGTSPYAAVNIGQGAEKGVGTYAALNQASTKEANDLQNQELALYKYGSAAENAKLNREALLSQYSGKLGERQTEFQQKQIGIARDDYREYVKDFETSLQKKYPTVALTGRKTPEYIAEENAFYNSPELKSLKRNAFPGLSQSSTQTTGSNLPPTVTKDGKTYVLQSNGNYIEKQ